MRPSLPLVSISMIEPPHWNAIHLGGCVGSVVAATGAPDTTTAAAEEGDDLRVVHLDLTTGELIADGVLITQTIDGINAEPSAARIYVELRDGEDGSNVTLRPLVPMDSGPSRRFTSTTTYGWEGSARAAAIGTSAGARVYDGETGEQVGLIPGSDLRGAHITPADQLIVTSLGGELTQYDLDTLEPIRTFGGAPGFIQELYGTADGSTIVLRGDRSVSLYDVARGVRLGLPISTPADDDISAVTMSADGSVMAMSGGIENGYQIWDLELEHWVEAACRIAGRNLTRQEWNTNIGDLAEFNTTCPEFSTAGDG